MRARPAGDDGGMSEDFRIEHDTMGEVRVPARAKWRAQTQRAVENFPISGRPLEPAQLHALASIKAAAARVNARLGVVDQDMAQAIEAAARDVARGEWDDEFPIDVFQTGSGTSSNMNANEVIARLQAKPSAARFTRMTTSMRRRPRMTSSHLRSISRQRARSPMI